MKRIKNFALFCTAIALLSAPAFSFDWGGKIYSDTSFIGKNNEALKLKETDNANLWLSVPLSKDNSKKTVFGKPGCHHGLDRDTVLCNNSILDSVKGEKTG